MKKYKAKFKMNHKHWKRRSHYVYKIVLKRFNSINRRQKFFKDITSENDVGSTSACQPGVSCNPGCTRIFQGCNNLMGCTRCVLLKNSHIVPHSPLLQRSVLTFLILKPYLSGDALSVFSQVFVCDVGQMTITYSSFCL